VAVVYWMAQQLVILVVDLRWSRCWQGGNLLDYLHFGWLFQFNDTVPYRRWLVSPSSFFKAWDWHC